MARAQSDKLIREAEGYGARRLAEAEGEITALLAKYESYRLAPEVTRQRMYLETMEKVFSSDGKKIILDENLKGMLPLLDLNK
jgi:membrane protease subunit HflK